MWDDLGCGMYLACSRKSIHPEIHPTSHIPHPTSHPTSHIIPHPPISYIIIKRMNPNIPQTDRKRVVIVGAGFGGLQLARKLSVRKEFQVVLINRHNYHEFQPLYYQVATAGLEANSILFPLRAVFGNCKNVHIRITSVTGVRHSRQSRRYRTGAGNL